MNKNNNLDLKKEEQQIEKTLKEQKKKIEKSTLEIDKNLEAIKSKINEDFVKYLTSLYQNVSTALQSIEDLMPKIEEIDESLKKELSNEYTNYDLLARECEMIAKSEKIDLKDNNWLEKLRLWSSINLTTLMDKSQRHLAEMMLLGTVMGLIQCLKDIKDYEKVSSELDDLCSKISELEERNYQKLKEFI